jgi:hypothetical protein
MTDQRPIRAYVAGPMRGIERFNFPAFDAARDWLIEQGWQAISPADLDRAYGITGYTTELPAGFIFSALRRDFQAICECDAIVFLDGWEASSGAKAERYVGEQIGLRFFHINIETGEIVEEAYDEAR